MKKWIAMLLVMLTLMTNSIPAMAAAAAIRKTEYEGSGYVEVDFKKNVQYKNARIAVKDSSGKSYTAKITDKDSDDLNFKVSGIAAGKTYAFVISGVRAGKSGSYGKVAGTFKVPAANKLTIKDIDYDRGDRELEIEFSSKVQYKNLKVQVKDAAGKSYTVKLRERDNNSVEVRVSGLKKGTKYAVQVSGVRSAAAGSYISVSKTFTA